MALTLCPECQKQVSSQAASCPHCGFPLSGQPKETQASISLSPPPVSTAAVAADFEDQLRRLAQLKDEGLSSEEEFNHKKKTFHFATAPGTEKPLAGTAAAQGQQPPKDQADKVWLGCLGIIVLLLLIVWIVGQASSGPTTTQYSGQESSPTLSSKAQWREKIRPYWNPGGPINVTTIVNFKALVGEPSQTQSIEGHAFWYYNCSDGTIQVELVAPSMSGGRMLIHGVNDY